MSMSSCYQVWWLPNLWMWTQSIKILETKQVTVGNRLHCRGACILLMRLALSCANANFIIKKRRLTAWICLAHMIATELRCGPMARKNYVEEK